MFCVTENLVEPCFLIFLASFLQILKLCCFFDGE